ncbi:MAG: hypothetical protein K0B87_05115 [Candidatus Syntrophosphaera sp.]|nr:hypothetical protein [Candidatus Syntrophosphaera sp.]
MNNRHFQTVMVLAILVPLLMGIVGYLVYGGHSEPQPVDSLIGQSAETGEPILINRDGTDAPRIQNNSFGFKELILYIALLTGVIALLYHYLKTSLVWLAVILLPLGFALLSLARLNISLTALYLPSLLFAALLALLVRFVFFNPSTIRFRMILTSLLGAALLTLYIRGIYLVSNSVFEKQQWSLVYVSALILFVFVSFGLSLADLVIQRALIKRRQAEEKAHADDEEDDEPHA